MKPRVDPQTGEVLDTPADIARQIASDLNVDAIVGQLGGLPQQIRDQQQIVQDARAAVEVAKGEVELHEAVLVAEITDEKDPRTGKAAFSNGTARKSELAKRKAASQEYLAATKALDDAAQALSTAQFDLDLLHNRFSELRTVAQLTTARLNLFAGAA